MKNFKACDWSLFFQTPSIKMGLALLILMLLASAGVGIVLRKQPDPLVRLWALFQLRWSGIGGPKLLVAGLFTGAFHFSFFAAGMGVFTMFLLERFMAKRDHKSYKNEIYDTKRVHFGILAMQFFCQGLLQKWVGFAGWALVILMLHFILRLESQKTNRDLEGLWWNSFFRGFGLLLGSISPAIYYWFGNSPEYLLINAVLIAIITLSIVRSKSHLRGHIKKKLIFSLTNGGESVKSVEDRTVSGFGRWAVIFIFGNVTGQLLVMFLGIKNHPLINTSLFAVFGVLIYILCLWVEISRRDSKKAFVLNRTIDLSGYVVNASANTFFYILFYEGVSIWTIVASMLVYLIGWISWVFLRQKIEKLRQQVQ